MAYEYIDPEGPVATTQAEKKANIEAAIRSQLKSYFVAGRKQSSEATAGASAESQANSDFGS